MNVKSITDNIIAGAVPDADEIKYLLSLTLEETEYLRLKAEEARKQYYGNEVFIRGLIELTNYCKNDCYYCGIRRGNRCADRYRLGKDEILHCCEAGYEAGFRTFVMQGGEDPYYTDSIITDIIYEIKNKYPDCAVTLSLGERSRESYKALYDAGADRYLLRHETATKNHYEKLHPQELSFDNRMRCLYNLKEIGFQTGCGFMVGSPYQTAENIAADLKFIKEFKPHMVGIGPFIPHKDTPFREEKPGSMEDTLKLLSIVRLMLPRVLLPATTALGTVKNGGRKMGILAGGNVIMPNLSPEDVRAKYMLYNNKLITGGEAAENLKALKESMAKIGCFITANRGDSKI